jgi:hypothetical protein
MFMEKHIYQQAPGGFMRIPSLQQVEKEASADYGRVKLGLTTRLLSLTLYERFAYLALVVGFLLIILALILW